MQILSPENNSRIIDQKDGFLCDFKSNFVIKLFTQHNISYCLGWKALLVFEQVIG